MKAPDADEPAVLKLSNSPYLAAVVDSILENLDRKTLTDLLAYYLYENSKGRANLGDLATYAVSKGLWKWMDMAASATPAVLAGMLADAEFRSVVISSVKLWIRGPPERAGAEKGP